ncbi:MAG: calcium-binding protein, partial [Hyphomonadaceae bacterium]
MARVRLIRSSVDFQWGIEIDLGSIVIGYSVQDGSFTAPPGQDLVLESYDRLNIHHVVTVDADVFRNAGQLYVFGGPDPQLTINAPVINEAGGLIRIFDNNGTASLTAPNSITNLGTIEVGVQGILTTPTLNNSGQFAFSGAALTVATAINNTGDLYLTGNDVGDTLITTPQLNTSDYLSVTPTAFAEFDIQSITNTGVIDVFGGPWVLAGLINNTYGGGGQLNGVLDGGGGNDTLVGGVFSDRFAGGAGNDSLSGGDGDDTLDGGANDDTLSGGNGVDTVTYANGPAVVVLLFNAAPQNTFGAGFDTITGVENAIGSALGDILVGSTEANVLNGGAGNDTLVGGAGNDTLIGGDHFDTVDYSGAGGGVEANLGTGMANNDGQGGFDILTQLENIIGTASADLLDGAGDANTLTGNGGNDRLRGAGGNDLLIGGAGIDTLEGGADLDTLDGGADGDILDGGSGADQMIGGTGDDRYIVDNAGDAITELAVEGFDQVESSISYTLAAEVDMLTLTGAAFTGTGNGGGNVIVGTGDYNILSGMG